MPDIATLVGAAAGTAVAASSWGMVQILGHASTGTAMAALHGAAAANAGWAWFGGGSLAAGGGGMAAGHLVLPGIGTVVAVAVSSVMSHQEANKLQKACDEIEGVNTENRQTLNALGRHVSGLQAFEDRLFAEYRLLEETVTSVYTGLLPFGLLSHFGASFSLGSQDHTSNAKSCPPSNNLNPLWSGFSARSLRRTNSPISRVALRLRTEITFDKWSFRRQSDRNWTPDCDPFPIRSLIG